MNLPSREEYERMKEEWPFLCTLVFVDRNNDKVYLMENDAMAYGLEHFDKLSGRMDFDAKTMRMERRNYLQTLEEALPVDGNVVIEYHRDAAGWFPRQGYVIDPHAPRYTAADLAGLLLRSGDSVEVDRIELDQARDSFWGKARGIIVKGVGEKDWGARKMPESIAALFMNFAGAPRKSLSCSAFHGFSRPPEQAPPVEAIAVDSDIPGLLPHESHCLTHPVCSTFSLLCQGAQKSEEHWDRLGAAWECFLHRDYFFAHLRKMAPQSCERWARWIRATDWTGVGRFVTNGAKEAARRIHRDASNAEISYLGALLSNYRVKTTREEGLYPNPTVMLIKEMARMRADDVLRLSLTHAAKNPKFRAHLDPCCLAIINIANRNTVAAKKPLAAFDPKSIMPISRQEISEQLNRLYGQMISERRSKNGSPTGRAPSRLTKVDIVPAMQAEGRAL